MYMTRGGNNINYCPENQLTKNNVEQELGGPSNRGPSGLCLPCLLYCYAAARAAARLATSATRLR